MRRIFSLSRTWHLIAYCVAAIIGYNGLVFREAKRAARAAGKPLLNAGCKLTYTEKSDVNCDIVHRAVPRFVRGDIQNLEMFSDKQFGAVYASHVLEHVENPEIALKELDRVADNTFVITPLPIWPWSWLHPHHRWIFWGTRKICRIPRLWKKK
ncbi:methyltransferase domain-containing protein [Chloroflexota bacterium]